MEAKEIINFRKLSYLLTGSSTKIHSKFIPKEYKNEVETLFKVIELWMSGKKVVAEDDLKALFDEFLIFTREKVHK